MSYADFAMALNVKKFLLLSFGHLFLVLGIIGAFLPVLPTTPFLLLSAYCYSKSSAKLHKWLMEHKRFGPPLKDWQEHGVINLKVKWIATFAIMLVMVFRLPTLKIDPLIIYLASAILFGVLIFIWTRPSHK